ncbi:unnamed protein product [Adineta steineri]|uniref:Chromatin assembly factor 1 subunit A dimerization domain-containing protein n=1 Tax=Adineta steineri TaxID=433720 RepID=A0A814DBY8_9BILA|nr:unnamed protein product [Adineta steineri]CAF1028555.1 unnamed protein product [Adineta steineri]CAF1389236.1 unnamed protein product [Adineta steineri]
MDSDNNNNQNNSSSSNECIVLTLSPVRSASSTGAETPTLTTPKIRLSKVEYTQRKSERDAKKAEEEAIRAERKRIQEELKAKKAEELRLEKARKAEELQLEKNRRAEEKARKLEELQQEKARKLEELQQEKARKAEELLQEKARKAEELQQEKARRAEEKARKDAEIASKKAELMQKKTAAQKPMTNTMIKYFKPIDKSAQKDTQSSTTNGNNINQRCTDDFDQVVSKQDMNFVSDIIENLKSMKKIDIEINSRPRLNSDSNSSQLQCLTTTMNNPYVIKTRYIHFPEKYFNRPPYYGTFKKASNANINPLKPDAPIDNIDYTVDSEGEWEEPCKDGEEIRSDAEDLSDAEAVDSDSDTDSFIVPHGHLSDDELNEDEQQQSTSTKQAREAAKSHIWDKKVARLNQQRELKPIFGCIYDPILDEKLKFELSNYLHQFQKILVPKEIYQPVEQDDKEQEINNETIPNGDKPKRVSKKKSLASKKGLTTEQQPLINPLVVTPTAKRISSVSILVEGASPSKRRKMNSNENCSTIDDTDVVMIDTETMNACKTNVLEDSSNVTDIKSSPLTIISNDEVKLDSTPICTLLIPKRKQPPV